MSEIDYQMALLLQNKFDKELSDYKLAKKLNNENETNLNDDKSLVDPCLELIDPTPNIYNLFTTFNKRYFFDKLQAVFVTWSKKMTSCAGICYYRSHGGLCEIKLSEPLLKLRPRKDLIETLLHEMIHAFLFVTDNNDNHDSHGVIFHKFMHRINKLAGTNITVYHNFHDEVRFHKQHWWRCDGPCQGRAPFYGMVKRAVNRAPGPNDLWWNSHKSTCDGKFIKIREPNKAKKINKDKVKGKENKNLNVLTKYFSLKNDTKTNIDDPTTSSKNQDVVNANKSSSAIVLSDNKEKDDYSKVRDYWNNKYPINNAADNKNKKRPLHFSSTLNIKSKSLKTEDSNTPQSDNLDNNIDDYIETNSDDKTISCSSCDNIVSKKTLMKHLDYCSKYQFNRRFYGNNIQFSYINCPYCLEIFKECDIENHVDYCLKANVDNIIL